MHKRIKYVYMWTRSNKLDSDTTKGFMSGKNELVYRFRTSCYSSFHHRRNNYLSHLYIPTFHSSNYWSPANHFKGFLQFLDTLSMQQTSFRHDMKPWCDIKLILLCDASNMGYLHANKYLYNKGIPEWKKLVNYVVGWFIILVQAWKSNTLLVY